MYRILPFRRKALCLFSLLFLSAILPAQDTTHPTINGLEVSYEDVDFINTDSSKLVRSRSVIALKSDTNITILHIKIIDEASNNIVYQVDYSLGSPPVSSADGVLLFKKDTNLCYINSAIDIPLKLYLYQVTTENSQGEVSEVYSDFK